MAMKLLSKVKVETADAPLSRSIYLAKNKLLAARKCIELKIGSRVKCDPSLT